jgi:hypothetical protein
MRFFGSHSRTFADGAGVRCTQPNSSSSRGKSPEVKFILSRKRIVTDKGRGVFDQALALEHNQDPANVLAIATWRNCFGYVASAERY